MWSNIVCVCARERGGGGHAEECRERSPPRDLTGVSVAPAIEPKLNPVNTVLADDPKLNPPPEEPEKEEDSAPASEVNVAAVVAGIEPKVGAAEVDLAGVPKVSVLV
jgi:hypothetical protein